MRRLLLAGLALACMGAPAYASHHREHHLVGKTSSHHDRHYVRHGGAGWCGAYMRHVYGISDPRLNLARNWASVGSNAGGPQVGAVVVWAHHVGVIRGGPNSAGEWLVESGNDGHAVRARYWSLRGAIAFRYVGGGGGLALNSGQQHYARYSRGPEQVRSGQYDFIWSRANMTTFTNKRRKVTPAFTNLESGAAFLFPA